LYSPHTELVEITPQDKTTREEEEKEEAELEEAEQDIW